MPAAGDYNPELLNWFEQASEAVIGIRNIRKDKNLPFKDKVDLMIKGENPAKYFDEVVAKLGNISSLTYVETKPAASAGFVVKATEYYIPLGQGLDLEAEKEKLMKELEYTQGFLASVEKKLNNEKFVSNAKPEVVENERQKQADAIGRMEILKAALSDLGI